MLWAGDSSTESMGMKTVIIKFMVIIGEMAVNSFYSEVSSKSKIIIVSPSGVLLT